ncbi:hypothetical protein [Enterobacter huaxiensis]|uniref:hypothetical protein n=1 Tax=Enterobacter huaxiensis TaxID=2494702 RepID=UPI000E73F332|nr:hypothetical protein [Enterobacter huaxiensis]UNC48950.1 hypothetical protein D5067_0004940 [Enterobacter huaxiensis]
MTANWLTEIAEKDYESKLFHNAFGVIIYTNANALMRKLIEDEHYWDALHDRSGEKWNIYCLKASKGKDEFPPMPRGSMGMMVPVWKEPRENKELLELFEINNTKDAHFVFFHFDEDKSIIFRKTLIEESSVEGMFNEVKKLIDEYTGIVEGVFPENSQEGTSMHIYAESKLSLDGRVKFLKKIISVARNFKFLIPS